MGYKLLGYVVWNGGKWYLRRRYGFIVPSRRAALAGVAVAGGVAVFLMAGSKSTALSGRAPQGG